MILHKQLLILVFFFGFYSAAFAQPEGDPKEITPAVEKKFKQEIEKDVATLKQQMKKSNEPDLAIEFAVDTFRIEQYMEKCLDHDYSTAGMRTASYDAAAKYDILLNKYYKKLLSVLKASDKNVLVKAQKAWIAYRDSEIKLIQTVSKDEYSGGGTIQLLIDSSSYLDLIKNRALEIYQYLERATGGY
jgi:uncharacterized protein YecT (DUF1311 family)